jgi:hypothetical protein
LLLRRDRVRGVEPVAELDDLTLRVEVVERAAADHLVGL